jgi:xylulokinase
MRRAYLGIDLGTSGVKVVLLDQSGNTLARTSHGYPVTHPTTGVAESDPVHWWQATGAAVHDATRRAGEVTIAGIGVDGQMHGLVLTDEQGTALRPAITWADTRAAVQAERWHNLPATARPQLANPVVPGMTGPLLAWLLDHEPRTVDRAPAVLLAKDWLRNAPYWRPRQRPIRRIRHLALGHHRRHLGRQHHRRPRAPQHLCVPRISSAAVTSRVARLVVWP